MSVALQYPVSNFAQALHVLNPNTKMDVYAEHLYVDLDGIRSPEFRDDILMRLGVQPDGHYGGFSGCDDKILLTGHRGSGKSVELERIASLLKAHYLTIHINIERELVKLSAITPEYLYQLLIIQLMDALAGRNIPFDAPALSDLIRIWDEERSVENSSSNKTTLEAGVEGEGGFSAWIFSLKARLAALVTAESEETEKISRRLRNNINEILRDLNVQIAQIKRTLIRYGLQGIVFVMDGTEKMPYDVAKRVFVQDAPVLQQISAPMIIASPVFSVHDIDGGASYFTPLMFPMVKLDPAKVAVFKQIITRRVQEELFFEDGALDCIARKSGGSIRQMLELAHAALLKGRGQRATLAHVASAAYDKGLMFWRRLDGPHKEILRQKSADYDFGNALVQQMLFSLILLAQNGQAVINPVVKPFVEGSENHGCE